MKFSIWQKWKKVKVCVKTCTGSEWSQIQYRKLLHYPQATKQSSGMIQRPFKCCAHIYLLTLHLRTSWIHPTELDHIWSIRSHVQHSKTCQTGIPVPIHSFWKKFLSEDLSHPQSTLTSLLLAVSLQVYNTSPVKNHVRGQNSFTIIQRITIEFFEATYIRTTIRVLTINNYVEHKKKYN